MARSHFWAFPLSAGIGTYICPLQPFSVKSCVFVWVFSERLDAKMSGADLDSPGPRRRKETKASSKLPDVIDRRSDEGFGG